MAVSDKRQAAYAQVDELLGQPRVERRRDGRAIEYVMLNNGTKDGDNEALEVMHLEWHTAVRDPGVRPLLAALALTGRRRMVVSSFGMGEASPLPKNIAKEIARTGSFITTAELLGLLYQPILADSEHVSLSGTSEGGRRAIGLAAVFSYVEDLFSHDSPGTRDLRGARGMGQALVSLEMEHAKRYVANATDPELVTAQRQQDSLRRFGGSVLHQLRVRNLLNLVYREPLALSRDGLLEDAKQAVPKVMGRFVLSAPEFSAMNRPEHVEYVAKRIAAKRDAVGESQPLIGVLEFPGTHSSGAANMAVTARLYELAHEI